MSTGSSPYRFEAGPERPEPPGPDAFEEHLLALVLLVAGLIGVAIGAVAPRVHATELTLGGILAALGAWTFSRQRIRKARSTAPRTDGIESPSPEDATPEPTVRRRSFRVV